MRKILTGKLALMTAFGVGLLALPFALPSTAQADDFRISLNLGGGGYYRQPVYQPVYRPVPQRVTYYHPAPQRIVYVSRPVYRQRVVYNNGWHGNNRGNGGGNHGGWNNRDRNMAWR